ncbi:BZ3500_MvSof-1268-A1-R1_Chr2-1g04102 [Microbotryum saponariae]|uniref:BZ3500_MvSof-1268-A1-R1_Chr2-1g04102 protein n=1 Tax=Microbotryum saponariae TaxID=289078 RepID=A0A2X0K5C5_9BASI|nr:BZ3500_MvSof-1268-A1-R1_Chr2-1g04102 [Microbotryum saponariae]SCZ91089.1 BZ3501_MvSof-1269-A2-R1_Chr2-1g03758 [Microbotryum saponariae]
MRDAPPAYTPAPTPRDTPLNRTKPSLLSLPEPILLLIISHCPISTIAFSLRATCHKLSTYALSVLRSVYLPLYASLVQAPNTSSPLSPPSSRECKVLDLFILGRSWVANEQSASELLLSSRTEWSPDQSQAGLERDIFNFLQPKARTEDLLIIDLLSTQTECETELDPNLTKDLKLVLTRSQVTLTLPWRSSNLETKREPVDKAIFQVPTRQGELLERLARRIAREFTSGRVRVRKDCMMGWYDWA